MSEVRARRAIELSTAVLTEVFNRGYSGYYAPVTLTEPVFREMVEVQDIDLESSRILEDDSGPVAFALLAVRGDRGWIGGMGVAPEARGRGIGREAMRAVMDAARARRLRSVDLEVLVQNTPAIPIYEALGFRDVRELGVWVREASAPAVQPRGVAIETIEPSECVARYSEMTRARPPWQRDRPVFERSLENLAVLGVREGGRAKAWIAFRAHPGQLRILDLAWVEGATDRIDACLEGMLGTQPGSGAMFLNVPMDAIEARALERFEFTPRFRQREMRVELD